MRARNYVHTRTRKRGGSLWRPGFQKCIKAIRYARDPATLSKLNLRIKIHRAEIFDNIRDLFEENGTFRTDVSVGKWQLGSAGKSGSFLGFSPSGRYIVKSLPVREFQKMLKILESYNTYLENHSSSLLTRFFGLYTVHHGVFPRPQHVIVMANALYTGGKRRCDYIYDLKGSWLGRKAKSGVVVLKDQDWCSSSVFRQTAEKYGGRGSSALKSGAYAARFLEFMQEFGITDKGGSQPVTFETTQAKEIISAIQDDVDFLRGLEVMDYSLLMGVKRVKKLGKKKSCGSRKTVVKYRVPPQSIVYISIIDFLSTYDMAKRVQHDSNVLRDITGHVASKVHLTRTRKRRSSRI